MKNLKIKNIFLLLSIFFYKLSFADGFFGLTAKDNTTIINGAEPSKLESITSTVVSFKMIAGTLAVGMIVTAVFTLYFSSENSLKTFAKLVAVLGIVSLAYIAI